MSKFGKFKEIVGIATPFAKPFIPGSVGTILDTVNQSLNKQPGSPGSEAAVKALAERVDAYNDEQDQAILSIHERLKKAGF